jgi:anaerobic selenocysteine-containing dehydrogenase
LEDLVADPQGVVYSEKVTHQKYKTRAFPTPSGKFEFTSAQLDKLGCASHPEYTPPDYLISATREFPLRMISGTRKAIYYHSRFREIGKFRKAIPRAQVEIHEDDAAELGIRDGETVKIVSRIGDLAIPAKIMEKGTLLKGFIDIPHGWNDPNVNCLTDDQDVDPVGGFPNLKIVPVRIEKIN